MLKRRKIKLARRSISSSQLSEEILAFFTLVQAGRAADTGHGEPDVGKGVSTGDPCDVMGRWRSRY